MSCCAPPRLYLNHWHAFYEILSSVWVAVHLLGSIWITDMPSMKSCPGCELLCTCRLYLNHWHAFYEILSRVWVAVHLPGSIWIADMSSMKSCPECELLCISQALFEWLTYLLWNPVQVVSSYAFPRLYLNHWHVFYEILSRMWVSVCLLSSI